MKQHLTLLAIFALCLTACPTDDGNGDGGKGATTTLRIKNESSKPIRNVVWNNVVFNDAQNPINKGNSTVKTLEEGSGYIFFDFYAVPYRTNSLIVVEKEENAEFTFLDSTVVIEVSNPSNSVTLGTLAIPPTTLTVTNSTSYGFFTVSYGDLDFYPNIVPPESGGYSSLNSGASVTKEVSAGTKNMEVSVYFGGGTMAIYMTLAEMITCEEGMPNQITVTNNTIVTYEKYVNHTVTEESGTLKNIVDATLASQKD